MEKTCLGEFDLDFDGLEDFPNPTLSLFAA